jgi:hypothetical protein
MIDKIDYSKLFHKLIPDNYLDSSGKIKEEFKYKINIPELKIKDSKFIPNPGDKFETMLFLPPNSNRIAEGGLRTKGLFKFSYKKVKSDFGENKNNASENEGIWYICDLDGNPVIPAPDDLQEKINQYISNSPSTTFLPLITVITVVYNGAKHLEDTIKSVINQTYPNVEYIIIDGGSTDGTIDIIKKYEDYIDYWVSEPDKGIYDAMNKGLTLSQGLFFIHINSGDSLLPDDALNNVIPLMSYNIDLIFTPVKYNSGKTFTPSFNWKIYLKNTIHHQGAFYSKKKVLELGGYDSKYKILSDYKLNLLLFKNKSNSVFFGKPVSVCLDGGISSRAKLKNYIEEISIRNQFLNIPTALFLDLLTIIKFLLKRVLK